MRIRLLVFFHASPPPSLSLSLSPSINIHTQARLSSSITTFFPSPAQEIDGNLTNATTSSLRRRCLSHHPSNATKPLTLFCPPSLPPSLLTHYSPSPNQKTIVQLHATTKPRPPPTNPSYHTSRQKRGGREVGRAYTLLPVAK